jgi:hypothetical protein
MKRIAILALSLILAACGTVQRVQQFNANVGTFNAGFEQLLSGKVSLPDFTLADLQNAKAVYDAHYAATANRYDKAGSDCMQAWISNLPAMQAILSPAAPAPQGAPVTGVFSALAAKQIAVEDAQAALAQRQALLRGGFPAEVTIACAPLWDVIGRALSNGGVKR